LDSRHGDSIWFDVEVAEARSRMGMASRPDGPVPRPRESCAPLHQDAADDPHAPASPVISSSVIRKMILRFPADSQQMELWQIREGVRRLCAAYPDVRIGTIRTSDTLVSEAIGLFFPEHVVTSINVICWHAKPEQRLDRLPALLSCISVLGVEHSMPAASTTAASIAPDIWSLCPVGWSKKELLMEVQGTIDRICASDKIDSDGLIMLKHNGPWIEHFVPRSRIKNDKRRRAVRDAILEIIDKGPSHGKWMDAKSVADAIVIPEVNTRRRRGSHVAHGKRHQ